MSTDRTGSAFLARIGLSRMRPRDPNEPHRAASSLELFFDLVFVVAVSFSSAQLHHLEAEGHAGTGVLGYLMVFFAIWWAWMNFTWFATSFATDDWLYRVMTIAQMAGVLILAAGAAPAMGEHDFTVVTIGYVIMRLALVGQWLRAAASDAALRSTALRYAVAIVIVQILWIIRLFVPDAVGFAAFFLLAAAEIAIPVWAESRKPAPWNPGHIAERYSLFTLILLGESILASASAVVDAIDTGHHIDALLVIAGSGLVIAAAMWWVYFAREHHEHIAGLRSSLAFGYFHYVIFAAAGAFSAGIEIAVDQVGGDSDLAHQAAAAMLSVPVGLYFLSVWWLTLRRSLTVAGNVTVLVGVIVIAASILAPGLWAVALVAAGAVVAVVAVEVGARSDSVLEA
ncbi:low temperature requirement protein A [Microbacterium sp. NPDC057944]|uniref:low temperature requirement protein A n=1 Tax=Microbacterium sp. NPDC057944 TaxID=3346286 RepID=UPI0036DABC06